METKVKTSTRVKNQPNSFLNHWNSSFQIRAWFAFLICLALGVQTSCKKDDDNKVALNAQDRAFFDSAAVSNLAEIDQGNLALIKGVDNAVKQYAQMMVTMHTSQNDSLRTLATQKGVTLPTTLPSAQQLIRQRLNALSGRQFDSAYINVQVVSHANTQANFQREISAGNDPDVKNFAFAKLPAITSHLQQAQQIKTSKEY